MRRRSVPHGVPAQDVRVIAEDAYVFAYPLLVMDVARRIHTSVPSASCQGAPANQFSHTRELAGAQDKDRPRPHADSLSSVAWVDLSRGPVVLSIPATDRYYLLPIHNAWFDLEAVISPRIAGEDERHFALVPRRWLGKLPVGLEKISCTTDNVWINGRFQAQAHDLESVHHLQDKVQLAHLNEWGKTVSPYASPFLPTVDTKTTPQDQVFKMDAATFFGRLSKLVGRVQPLPCDARMIERLSQMGISPGTDFFFEMLDEDTSQSFTAGLNAAQLKITNAEKGVGPQSPNQWSVHTHPGRFETRYLDRAVTIRQGLAAAPAEDAICFYTNVDQTGQALKGGHHYVVHFEPNGNPPVNAFWSIALYNARHHLTANPINRHLIGGKNRLRIHSDNSLSIYIQHEWPGIDRDSNWLPAPGDAFELVLQLYWPKLEVLQDKWRPPAVVRVQ